MYTTWDQKQSNTQITNIYPITNQNFFFWISNVKILLIIERVSSRVHWGCNHKPKIKSDFLQLAFNPIKF